mmetsp:Transcript_30641/g.59079  ORF Transcript_30641/g.59079 Transcript_30641/m.59079 type:complete len:305 (+) Transcript_30641:165-1079(+)
MGSAWPSRPRKGADLSPELWGYGQRSPEELGTRWHLRIHGGGRRQGISIRPRIQLHGGEGEPWPDSSQMRLCAPAGAQRQRHRVVCGGAPGNSHQPEPWILRQLHPRDCHAAARGHRPEAGCLAAPEGHPFAPRALLRAGGVSESVCGGAHGDRDQAREPSGGPETERSLAGAATFCVQIQFQLHGRRRAQARALGSHPYTGGGHVEIQPRRGSAQVGGRAQTVQGDGGGAATALRRRKLRPSPGQRQQGVVGAGGELGALCPSQRPQSRGTRQSVLRLLGSGGGSQRVCTKRSRLPALERQPP